MLPQAAVAEADEGLAFIERRWLYALGIGYVDAHLLASVALTTVSSLWTRDTLHIEARFPGETIRQLERRGHVIDRWGEWNELAGHAHGITSDARTGVRCGGSDPRSDGEAIGC